MLDSSILFILLDYFIALLLITSTAAIQSILIENIGSNIFTQILFHHWQSTTLG